jgi:hypothetical protein
MRYYLLLWTGFVVGSFIFVACDMIFIQVGVDKCVGVMNHFLYLNAPILGVQDFL